MNILDNKQSNFHSNSVKYIIQHTHVFGYVASIDMLDLLKSLLDVLSILVLHSHLFNLNSNVRN